MLGQQVWVLSKILHSIPSIPQGHNLYSPKLDHDSTHESSSTPHVLYVLSPNIYPQCQIHRITQYHKILIVLMGIDLLTPKDYSCLSQSKNWIFFNKYSRLHYPSKFYYILKYSQYINVWVYSYMTLEFFIKAMSL